MSASSCDPITLEVANEMLALYLQALRAVSSGQSYSIDGRSLTRANIAEISKQVQYWRGQVMRLCQVGHGGPTIRRSIPHG